MGSFQMLGRYGGDWVRSVQAVSESVVPSMASFLEPDGAVRVSMGSFLECGIAARLGMGSFLL